MQDSQQKLNNVKDEALERIGQLMRNHHTDKQSLKLGAQLFLAFKPTESDWTRLRQYFVDHCGPHEYPVKKLEEFQFIINIHGE